MKFERGIVVEGFNAELTLQSRDGQTHSFMSDCPEDMDHIMNLIQQDVRKKIERYLEHLREGHSRASQ